MSPLSTKSGQQPPDAPGEISKWTRVYAQNRSLGVVVFFVVFVVLTAAIGGFSYLAGQSYRDGNMLYFWAAIAGLVPVLGVLIYFSTPRWGGKLMDRIVQRLAGGLSVG